MITDWLMYILHLTFTNIGFIRTILIILLCIGVSFITFFVGTVRWWWIKRCKLTKLWNRQRKEYEQEIEEKNALIEEQKRLLNFYKNEAFVNKVDDMQKRAG